MNQETDQEESQAPQAEQAADLAALVAAANGAPAAAGATVPATVEDEKLPPPSAPALQMAGTVVKIARPLIAYAVPALRDAPDALWEPIPEGVAVVMDHYGAKAEWMKSPWARLAMALAPLAAYGAAVAMSKPEPAKAAGEALPAPPPPPGAAAEPGSNTVSFGTVEQ